MAFSVEEKEKKEEERQNRMREASSEMDEMDLALEGMNKIESKEEETETEETNEPGDSGNREVEEKEKVIEEKPTEDATASEEVPEDEYEFDAEFVNEMARAAIAKGSLPEVAPSAPAAPAEVKETPVVEAPVSTAPGAPVVSLEEMQQAFESPQKMVDLIQRVFDRAKAEGKEEALRELPHVSRQVAMQVAEQAQIVRKFYEVNPELEPYKDFVKYCAMQVEAKHPDWTYGKVAEETAKLAKNRLPILRRAQRDAKQKPALPGSSRSAQRRSNAPKGMVSSLEQEISDMPDGF